MRNTRSGGHIGRIKAVVIGERIDHKEKAANGARVETHMVVTWGAAKVDMAGVITEAAETVNLEVLAAIGI